MKKQLQEEKVFDGADILDAHLQIMQDPLLNEQVEEEIRSTGKKADYVFQTVIKKYQKKMDSIEDPFFRERFKDIKGNFKKNCRPPAKWDQHPFI